MDHYCDSHFRTRGEEELARPSAEGGPISRDGSFRPLRHNKRANNHTLREKKNREGAQTPLRTKLSKVLIGQWTRSKLRVVPFSIFCALLPFV